MHFIWCPHRYSLTLSRTCSPISSATGPSIRLTMSVKRRAPMTGTITSEPSRTSLVISGSRSGDDTESSDLKLAIPKAWFARGKSSNSSPNTAAYWRQSFCAYGSFSQWTQDGGVLAADHRSLDEVTKSVKSACGLQDHSEMLFILATNRPDQIEPALASRPGRIDQAIELPLPVWMILGVIFELKT